ncbi:class I SAM-dependent methyltransferase [Shewanella decolorationis]|uniref:Methyltransferase domain protein n=1 Tax=Shewanella decolorationis S12 TaxID=1353536 RepID=A0ABP2Z3S4_9GAMM|nr:class I SAM-dependent methyltransferase [Shewanella decolorationis]ESE41166.1 methyltransferase domain protein [Shewanella decolorationis S12]GLR31586.1 hypothetical protein GCM10007922_11430 [Shewanella decolorationis]
MYRIKCQLCGKSEWTDFSEITFGLWHQVSHSLERQSNKYPLSRCNDCGHVQVSIEYTQSLFDQLYFHSAQEAVMWDEEHVISNVPYMDMLNFSSPLILPNVIVDFGCGDGKLLKVAREIYPTSTLIGIDFNNRCDNESFEYISFNLNKLTNLNNSYWTDGIDFAVASHILEHVLDPISFLTEIGKRLKKEGTLFVEVPDFSLEHPDTSIGMSNLVNLQHIHYFTLDSLALAAKTSGLKLIKYQQFSTGYIPRLQVLLKRNDSSSDELLLPKNSPDPSSVIVKYQSKCKSLRLNLAECLIKSVQEEGKCGLWGIGADFCALLNENPELDILISQKKLVLFDYNLKEYFYKNNIIQCSSEIEKFPYSVYMCPLLAETRLKMREVSSKLNNVKDTFLSRND